MKKITSLFIVFVPLAFMISSCKKESEDITKTINVNLNVNESYSSQLEAGDADDVMQISSQAQHSLVSTVSPDPGTNANVFHYTPALDYTGTDEVQITNSEGEHHGNHGNGGNCSGHHHDDNVTYIYKINIKSSTTGAKPENFRVQGIRWL